MRRRLMIAFAVIAVALGAAGVSGVFAVRHEPEFWKAGVQRRAAPEARQRHVREIEEQAATIEQELTKEAGWHFSVTDEAVNSWLYEKLEDPRRPAAVRQVSEPYVVFEENRVKAACRFDGNRFSGIVSVELIPLPPEGNDLPIEIVNVRLGAIPLPVEQLGNVVIPELTNRGIQLRWKKDPDRRILLLDMSQFSKLRESPLQGISIAAGSLTVEGAPLSAPLTVTTSAMRPVDPAR